MKQARAIVTRERVLRAAGTIFGRVRYSKATLVDVADEVGMTTGVIYFHFGSKQELARALIIAEGEIAEAIAKEALAGSDKGLAGLRTLSYRWAEQIQRNPIVGGGVRVTFERPELVPEINMAYLVWLNTSEMYLRDAAEAGELVTRRSPEEVAYFVTSAFTGVHLMSSVLTEKEDLLERVDQMWDIVLHPLTIKALPETIVA
ncbi:ScbR family autoregulator-binding transcription factor [Microbacterium rhizomatis]|nr:ScbR family autoregulator-binding transcription factor [Microbacterium rhizomatis]